MEPSPFSVMMVLTGLNLKLYSFTGTEKLYRIENV